MNSPALQGILENKHDSSLWMLVVANLFPLAGVLFWDWSVFDVVALYWLENVVIGAINVLKMLTCSPDAGSFDPESWLRRRFGGEPDQLTGEQNAQLKQARAMLGKMGKSGGMLTHGMKFFLIPFFCVHYGLFCFVHGVFVFALLGGGGPGAGPFPGGGGFESPFSMVGKAISDGGGWAVLALVLSHLYSFFTNYLGKGEYRRTIPPLLMMAPYGRIVVLHLAILFGAFAIMALGSPLFLLVLLIAGKIVLDLKLHLRSHRKLAEAGPSAPA